MIISIVILIHLKVRNASRLFLKTMVFMERRKKIILIAIQRKIHVEYDFHMILYYRANDKLFSPC